MLKNILLPLSLICLTSFVTIYFWFENSPLSFLGLIGFLTLGFGSMYISYFIFYKIFPDKRNVPLPSFIDLPHFYSEQKSKPQSITKGSLIAALFAFILTGLGVYLWTIFADKYKEYHLQKYGQEVKSVIVSSGYSKGLGTFREYEFKNSSGKIFKDKFSNNNLKNGDTILVRFSTERPSINKVVYIPY